MADYVDQAERVMRELHDKEVKNTKYKMVTKAQIRKFLTAVNAVTGEVEQYRLSQKGAKLPEDLRMQVKFLKVKLAYQIGRMGTPVKDFNDKAELMDWIDGIGDSVEKYQKFASYVEALVAFHKFYGGKD